MTSRNLFRGLPFLGCLAFLLASPHPVYGIDNLLANGDFNSGITPWTLDMATATTLGWDAGVGNPSPGSLLLSASAGGFVSGYALSECFEPPIGTEFTVRSKVLALTDSSPVVCWPYISRFNDAGCSGSRDLTGFSGTTPFNEPGVWETRSQSEATTADRPSFRVALFVFAPTADGSESCNFDSVELFEGSAPSIVEVPTASRSGLILLGLTLALAGFWAMRHAA